MRKIYLALALASVLLAGSVYAADDTDTPPAPREEYGMGWGHRGGGYGRRHGREWRDRDGGEFRRCGPMGPGHRMGGDFRGHRGFGGGQGMGMGMGMMGEGMGKGMGPYHCMFTDLDLTADQKAKLVDALTKNYQAKLELMMEMADARQGKRDMRRDEDVSYDDIIASHRALGEAQGKMEVQERIFRDEIKGILTLEQWERLDCRPHRDWDRDDDSLRPPRDGKRPGPGPRK